MFHNDRTYVFEIKESFDKFYNTNACDRYDHRMNSSTWKFC